MQHDKSDAELKAEIVDFIIDSTEEANLSLAAFIAGMQAQREINKSESA